MQDDLLISRREILAILFRHRFGIFALLLASVSTAIFTVYYLISPSYESSAVIIINSSYLTEPLRDGPPESEFEKLAGFHTQRDILSSERLAAEAVKRTGLDKKRVIGRVERITMFIGDVKRVLGGWFGIEKWTIPWDPFGAAVAAVHDGVETFALPDSKALRITLRGKDPAEAAEVLAALIAAHRDYYYDEVRRKAQGAVTFLEKEHARSSQDLYEAEQALFHFKKGDRVLRNPARTSPGGEAGAGGILGLTDSSKVQEEIKLYVLKLEEELRVASQNPNNEERERITSDIRARIAAYLSSLNSLPEKELELVRLKREFDTAQDSYQLIHRNLVKASLVASGDTDKIHLVDVFEQPSVSQAPVFPKKIPIVLLSLVLGSVLALTWAFVMDYLDHTIRSGRDIQRFLDTRLIASLPSMPRMDSRKGAPTSTAPAPGRQ
ncbi:MAG: GNVR domain-containing protein [Pseudomonadota bacterium]